MLVSFFKPNQPAPLIAGLPIVALLLWIPGFLKYPLPVSFDNTMPLYDAMVYLTSGVPYFSNIVSLLLVFLQALLLNSIVNKNEMLSPKTNLPALMYILVMSSITELQIMHPVIFANLFVLFAIKRTSTVYLQKTVFSQMFDAGALIAIASFFYFPAIVFFLFIWGSLIITRTFIWREYIIALVGVAVPYVFLSTYYYLWTGDLLGLVQEKFTSELNPANIVLPQLISTHYALVICLLVLLGLSILTMFKVMANSVLRIQYLLKTLVVLLFTGLVAILFDNSRNLQTIALAAIPFAVFTGNYFLHAKRRWLAECILLCLLGFIIFNFFV
ncbi:MAG: hypothetical protein H0V01_13680 [Bacteroidetes bacterium]|nr:hypothetical protein [Bacteroidota bacterium]HET6245429.1 DUF6427 family protein [Bacteroidia bacterium]